MIIAVFTQNDRLQVDEGVQVFSDMEHLEEYLRYAPLIPGEGMQIYEVYEKVSAVLIREERCDGAIPGGRTR